MKTPILGASYVARSPNAAYNRCVNLYPEAILEGGKELGFLSRAPGLKFLQAVGTGPIRGLWSHETRGADFYIASGTEFYKSTSLTGTPIKLGNISGTGPVSIADNGTQLFIACNGPSYIYNEATEEFGPITDPDFPGAGTVAYIDGYFVFNQPNTQLLWATSLLDGTTIDPLDFASAEGSPDGAVAIAVDHRELWVFGTETIEVWYNAALDAFPFARLQGAFSEIGCAAPYSVAKLDNALFWVGADARGSGIVYKNQGYAGVRISTHAIEQAIQKYPDISDARGYTYQQEGHAFYVLNFPAADTTWVYDIATGVWHERAGFSDGAFVRHRGDCQCNFANTTIVGDFSNANIYALDLETYSDNGLPQKWLRSWRVIPPGRNDLKRTAQHALTLDIETGVGLNLGQGSDPQVMLRWSDDAGHTWSSEHWRSAGKIGDYKAQVQWHRLGMTTKLRDRIYEVSGTDPVKVTLLGAEIDIKPTKA